VAEAVAGAASDVSSAAIEDTCFGLLRPFVFPEKKPQRPPALPPSDPPIVFGCWRVGRVSDEEIDLHIGNPYRPESLFDHREEVVADLRSAVSKARESMPALRTVGCTTWLNSTRRFPGLFPESYAGTIEVADEPTRRGLGWWGQYVTREGGFNTRTAGLFRQSGGVHPYPMARGWCTVAEILSA
jgi:hypothetical protein